MKFSGAAGTIDGKGFFYSRFDEPAGGKLESTNYFQKLFYHTLGTPQGDDKLIYKRDDQKEWEFGGDVSEDGRYLLLSISQGTERKNRLYYRDVTAAGVEIKPNALDTSIENKELRANQLRELLAKAPVDRRPDFEAQLKVAVDMRRDEVNSQGGMAHGFVELLNDFDAQYRFIGNDGPLFYIYTDQNAPRGRVIAIDSTKPARE